MGSECGELRKFDAFESTIHLAFRAVTCREGTRDFGSPTKLEGAKSRFSYLRARIQPKQWPFRECSNFTTAYYDRADRLRPTGDETVTTTHHRVEMIARNWFVMATSGVIFSIRIANDVTS
jgi:hypothetical protein